MYLIKCHLSPSRTCTRTLLAMGGRRPCIGWYEWWPVCVRGRGCTWSPVWTLTRDQKLPLPGHMSAIRPAPSPWAWTPWLWWSSSSSGPSTSLGQMSYSCSVQAGLQDLHRHITVSLACIINAKASGSRVKVWDVLAGERCHARPCALTHSCAAGRCALAVCLLAAVRWLAGRRYQAFSRAT